jgi:hypothetical protein
MKEIKTLGMWRRKKIYTKRTTAHSLRGKKAEFILMVSSVVEYD